MSAPTKAQLEALTALLGQLRHDWDTPGIRAALARAAHLGTGGDIAVAACRIAANPDAHTPGLIPTPGTHWQGTTAGLRPVPIMCIRHPDQKAGHCLKCFKAARPKPASFTVPKREVHAQEPAHQETS